MDFFLIGLDMRLFLVSGIPIENENVKLEKHLA
jgi:hypothetical protein